MIKKFARGNHALNAMQREVVSSYLTDIWRLRYFWMSLVRVDLRAKYRRSILGIGWSLMHPIFMTFVFCAVFATLFKLDVRTYAPFLLVGLAFWNFVSGIAHQGCQCFINGEAYIRQQSAPMAIYPLRTTLACGFHFLIALVVAILLSFIFGGVHNALALVYLVPALVMLFLFGWCLALLCGVMNVLFQDTQHVIEILLQVLFYLTPIMYPPSMLAERRIGWIAGLNPLAGLVETLRRPILEGLPPSLSAVAMVSGLVIVMILLTAFTLSRLERRLVFYL